LNARVDYFVVKSSDQSSVTGPRERRSSRLPGADVPAMTWPRRLGDCQAGTKRASF
jgi:hypothetical protein